MRGVLFFGEPDGSEQLLVQETSLAKRHRLDTAESFDCSNENSAPNRKRAD